MLVSSASIRTSACSFLFAGLAIGASLWGAVATVKSEEKECAEEADGGEFYDLEGFAETVAGRAVGTGSVEWRWWPAWSFVVGSEFIFWTSHVALLVGEFGRWRRWVIAVMWWWWWWWWMVEVRRSLVVTGTIEIWVFFMAMRSIVAWTFVAMWGWSIEIWFIKVRLAMMTLGAIEVRTLIMSVWWGTIEIRAVELRSILGWRRVLPVVSWGWCIEVRWRWHVVVWNPVRSVFWAMSMIELLIWSSWWLAVRKAVMEEWRRRSVVMEEGWWRWIPADR
jgi:hypothetical protein